MPMNADEIMRKLFIGGVPRTTNEDTLKGIFGQYGTINDCVVIKDKETQTSRGFAFVTFESEESVEKILAWDDANSKLINTIEVDGKAVDVKRAIPRDNNDEGAHADVVKLFIGGLAQSVKSENVQEELDKRHATAKCGSISSITLKYDDAGKSKGYGFITVTSKHYADRLAIKEETIEIHGKKGSLKKAKQDGAAGGGRGGGRGGPRGGRGGERGGTRGGRGSRGGQSGGYQQNGDGYQQSGGYGQSQGGYGGAGGYGQSAAPAYAGQGSYGGGSYGQGSYGASPSYAGGYGEQSTAYPGQSYGRGGAAGGRGGAAGGRGGYKQY